MPCPGDLDRAESLTREALQIFEQIDEPDEEGWARGNLAAIVAASGRVDEARDLARSSLMTLWTIGDMQSLPSTLEALGDIEERAGDAGRGICLVLAARQLRSQHGVHAGDMDKRCASDVLRRARDRLGGPVLEAALQAADAASAEEIVQEELKRMGAGAV